MAEVIQSRGIQRTLQRESDKQYKFEIADAKRTERLLRKQIIEQRNFENDQIENAKRKAKFELLKQRELRIIVEIKQAFPLSEVAKNAGISKNRLELLVLSRTVGIFSPESVAAVFRPRMHGTLDEDGRYSCYSANAVTFAKAHDLSVWQKIAEQIEQAQEGDDPLEDIRCHLRGELTERERVRLFFYVPSKFWKINDPFRTLNGIFWLASNPDTPEEEFPDTFGDITSCREWLTMWKSKKIWQKIVLIQQQAKFQGVEAKWLSSQ